MIRFDGCQQGWKNVVDGNYVAASSASKPCCPLMIEGIVSDRMFC